MEISLRTSPTSYAVCDVEVKGYGYIRNPIVMIRITPRTDDEAITLDVSLSDWLELLTNVTAEFQKEHP